MAAHGAHEGGAPMTIAPERKGIVDLTELGITPSGDVFRNPTTPNLYEHAVVRGQARIAHRGPFVVDTGRFTGRSPKDKFAVREPESEGRIWWGPVNGDLSEQHYDGLRAKVADHLSQQEPLYVVDAFAGADPKHRISLRVVTAMPYHALFSHTMFITPSESELQSFTPQAVVLHAPGLEADPEEDGTRTGTFCVFHPTRREILIGGTYYAGEIKKSIFTLMNDSLPLDGVLPMHCSANVGHDTGDVAIFFGLSGTGKTTLSADPARKLIGDDEHGWSDSGVFNFEGGCYAKCINLSRENEPQIWNAIRFGAVVENVAVDPITRAVDYADTSLTENTRVAYPVEYIDNAELSGIGGHPRTIIFLTADAFGVLPPIARLTPAQARYHFLSGYTAKTAGTEIGVQDPEATFSACFGAPFLPLAPQIYAQMLGERLARHDVRVFLLNTGWTGGPYGVGQRIKLSATRTMVSAALSGGLDQAET